jgi:hypothetical protein
MNRKQLENMLYAILRLNWPILMDDGWGNRRPLDVLWRVTGYLGEGATRQMKIETLSQTLGLRLALYFDSIIEFQNEDLYHPSFKQGLLVLKSQWIVPPEGRPAWRVPVRGFRLQGA